MSSNGDERRFWQRLYKGHCLHASYWSIVEPEHARTPWIEVICPGDCGVVKVYAAEP